MSELLLTPRSAKPSRVCLVREVRFEFVLADAINAGGYMRTTLTIDDDVLVAVKEMAAHQQKSLGEVMSALVRQALVPVRPVCAERNGIPLLSVPSGAAPVMLEMVNQLRDELP